MIKAGTPARKIEIDLAGVRNLVLVVEDAGDGNGWDHADWAMAKIEYAGERPEPTVALRPEPYILTPQPGPAPRINGPRVFGTRPGNPFVYRIPTTGERPMTFRAENLPAGLTLDPQSGIITGNSPADRGDYPITLQALQTGYDVAALGHYLPLVARIIHQAHQRVIEGQTLRPDEKLYSLFEEPAN